MRKFKCLKSYKRNRFCVRNLFSSLLFISHALFCFLLYEKGKGRIKMNEKILEK